MTSSPTHGATLTSVCAVIASDHYASTPGYARDADVNSRVKTCMNSPCITKTTITTTIRLTAAIGKTFAFTATTGSIRNIHSKCAEIMQVSG